MKNSSKLNEITLGLAVFQILVLLVIVFLGDFRGYELSEEQYMIYLGFLLLNLTPILIIGIVVSSILDAVGIEQLFRKLSE